jgi:hypothetical protein
MTKILHPLAADAREIDRLRDEAERLARDIARRHPRMLALACARADPEMGPGLAAAWTDMIREGCIDVRATPVSEIVSLLCIEPDETCGPLRQRLATRADVVEALADAEFAGWMDDVDAQDAA